MLLWHKKCHYFLVDCCIFFFYLVSVKEQTPTIIKDTYKHRVSAFYFAMFAYIKFQTTVKVCSVSEHAATHLFGWWHYGSAAEIRVATNRPDGCFSAAHFEWSRRVHQHTHVHSVRSAVNHHQHHHTNVLLHWDGKPVMFDFKISLNIKNPTLAQIPILLPWMNL